MLTGFQFAVIFCGSLLAAFALPWLIHWWQNRYA
jgi:hypothetical protein